MGEDNAEILLKRTLQSENLLKSLLKLKVSDDLDNVILDVNSSKLSCHKSVLAAESPYFKAMFNSNMKESRQDEIKISVIDFSTLKTVVNYFYNHEIKMSENNMYDLIEAVNYLQIASLRPLCDQFLSSIIKPSNCITIHVMAARYGYYDVSVKAFHYALENFSKVFLEEDFLEAPFELISDIFSSRVLQVESEDQLCYAMRYWIDYNVESRHVYLPHLFSMLELDKIFKWVPLGVDKYLITYGIIDRVVCEWLSKKYTNDAEKTSKRSLPLEICFAIGGYTIDYKNDSAVLSSTEVLQPQENWQFKRPQFLKDSDSTFFNDKEDIAIPSMSRCRSFPGVACSDELIYVLGGNDGSGPIDHAESYDPMSNKWRTLPPLPLRLEGTAAAYTNRRIYVTGGYNQNIGINNKVWFYEDGCRSWKESIPMLHKRSHHSLVVVHGILYAIGGSGEDGKALSSVECFYSGLDAWIEVESLLTPRSHLACIAYDDKIFAVCGRNSTTLDTIERYDVSSNKWEFFNKFIGGRYGHGVSIFQDRLLIIGGRNSCLKASDSVHKLNLNASSSIWHEANKLIRSRVGLVSLTLKLYGKCCIKEVNFFENN